MWRFSTLKSLKEFRSLDRGKVGVFSLYLDDAYSPDLIDSFLNMKIGFDGRVGAKWHILIPCSDGKLTPDFIPDMRDYSAPLALEICEKLEIPPQDMPCLVFKEPTDNVIFYISFSGDPIESVVKTVREISAIITRGRPSDESEENLRKEIIGEIHAFTKDRELKSKYQAYGKLFGIAKLFVSAK